MTWVLIGGAWVALAVVAALVIGRSIGLADRQSVGTRHFVVDLPEFRQPAPRTAEPAERPADTANSETVAADEPPEDPSTIPGIPSARPTFLPPVPPSTRPKPRRHSEAG
jgi:hypothetical protein